MEKFITEEKMFNDSGANVTKYFEQGRTFFVKALKEAQEMTKKVGYYYEVFVDKKNVGRIHYGYGIPK